MAIPKERGVEALNHLRSTEPASWLAPSTSLAEISRAASQHLFSVLRPHAPKSPFDELLVNGFDAEQIWQQIDLQSQPLLSRLRRDVRKYEKNPEEIAKIGKFEKNPEEIEKIGKVVDDVDDMDVEDFYDDYEEDEVGEGKENEGGEETESKEGESDVGEQENGKGRGVVEDGFLKIKELEEFMVEDEAREYGLKTKKNKKNKKKKSDHDSDEEEEEEKKGKGEKDDDDEEEEEDELDFFGYGGDEDDGLDNARYEDFFGSKKNKVSKQNSKPNKGPEEDSDSDDGQDEESIEGSEADSDSDDGQEDERNNHLSTHDGSKELLDSDDGQDKDKRNNNLSTHEKHLKKLRSEIEKNEKANLEPKTWTMQGEVTATKRPKNSALEVDLDFEHNLRPAPVITAEVTELLEEIIQKRILEERFDDVQTVPSSLVKAPRELKELDENKSKKGLAEVYENEFVQKTDPASALSFSDEQKNEAKTLFKKICLKLDALSHFHFAPKPVIEDMSIQANVPALAMEEIAPMAVSDAAMLAPEEVFDGKGNIKEEAELTQAERKRRRANKKRKFKSEEAKRTAKKPRERTLDNGKEEQ